MLEPPSERKLASISSGRHPPPRDDSGFAILHMNPEFVVVDKPPNCAMDGDVAAYADRSAATATPSSGTTVEKWVHTALADFLKEPLPPGACTVQGGGRPVLDQKSLKFVHQLDYATSGLLCLAFSKDMAATVAHCFEFRQTRKVYSALVHGWIPDDKLTLRGAVDAAAEVSAVPQSEATVACGARRWAKTLRLAPEAGAIGAAVVDDAVAIDPDDPEGFRMRTVPAGVDLDVSAIDRTALSPKIATKDFRPQAALSVISVMARGYLRPSSNGAAPSGGCESAGGDPVPVTWVRLRLYTGRRHQLRLHCRALGHPIVGDHTYEAGTPFVGVASRLVSRLMLHAWRLTIGADIDGIVRLSAKERQAQRRARRRETNTGIEGSGAAGEDADAPFPVSTTFEAADVLAEFFTAA